MPALKKDILTTDHVEQSVSPDDPLAVLAVDPARPDGQKVVRILPQHVLEEYFGGSITGPAAAVESVDSLANLGRDDFSAIYVQSKERWYVWDAENTQAADGDKILDVNGVLTGRYVDASPSFLRLSSLNAAPDNEQNTGILAFVNDDIVLVKSDGTNGTLLSTFDGISVNQSVIGFVNSPTAPTPSGANDNELATVEYVDNAASEIAINTSNIQANATEIAAINALLASDESALDTIQEIVDFIQINADSLQNLSIGSIAGLQPALDALQSDIVNEQTQRASQDAILQSNISTESASRAAADTALQQNITNEATSRAQGDASLQAAIDAEEIVRQQADENLQNQITNLQGQSGSGGGGSGDLVAANNLGDLDNPAVARQNLGLGNVNNTPDSSKPISAATQAALNTKASITQLNTKADESAVAALVQEVADIETGGEEFATLTEMRARDIVSAADAGRRVTLMNGTQAGTYVLYETLQGTAFSDDAIDNLNIVAITAGGFAVRDIWHDLSTRTVPATPGDLVETSAYRTQANPTFMQFWTGQDARTNFFENTHGQWEARTNAFGLVQDFVALKSNGLINEYGLPTAIPAGADYVLSPPMMAGWARFNSWMRDLGPMIYECDVDVQPEIINNPGILTPIADGPTGLKRWRFQMPTTHSDFVYVLWRAIPQEPTITACYPENVDPSADGGWAPWFVGKGAQYERRGVNRYDVIRTLDLDNFNPKDIISVDQINSVSDNFWGAPNRTPSNLAKCGIPFESLFTLSEATDSTIWHLIPMRLGADRIFDDTLPGSPLFYSGDPVPEFYTDYVQQQAPNILASDEFEKWIQAYYAALHAAPASVKSKRHILEVGNELWNVAPNFYLLSYMAMAIAHAVNPAWQTNPTFEFNGTARQGLGYLTARAIQEWDRLQAANGTDYELIWAVSCQTANTFSINAAMEGFDFYCNEQGLSAATIADMKSRCQSFGTSYWEGALSNRDINGNTATPPLWGILGRSSWEEIRDDYNSGALSEQALLDGIRQFYDDASLANYLTIPKVRSLHNEFAIRSADLGLGGKWGILPHGGCYEGTTHEDQNSLAPNITQAQLDLLAVWYGSVQFADVTLEMQLGLVEDHGSEFLLSNYPINAMTDDGSTNGGNIGRFIFHQGHYDEETEQFKIWDEIFLQITTTGTPGTPEFLRMETGLITDRIGTNRTSNAAESFFEYLLNDQVVGRIGYFAANRFSIAFSDDGITWDDALTINPSSGDYSLRQGAILKFPTVINGNDQEMSVRVVNGDFIFTKPYSDTSLADGAKYVLSNVGSNNSGNAFWQGVHLVCPTVRENGADRFPRYAVYWSYSSTDNPTNLKLNITPGVLGGLSAGLRFRTGNGAPIELEGGPVLIGDLNQSGDAALQVGGAARVGNYTVASLPSASSQGSGAIAFVTDESGGPVLAFSDGADWRRSTDRAVVS